MNARKPALRPPLARIASASFSVVLCVFAGCGDDDRMGFDEPPARPNEETGMYGEEGGASEGTTSMSGSETGSATDTLGDGDGDGDGDGESGDGDGDGDGAPPQVDCGFDEAVDWPLPYVIRPFYNDADGWSGSAGCAAGQGQLRFRYESLDVNADGRIDMIVKQSCLFGDFPELSKTYVDVFLGAEGGYEELPIKWPLPGAEYPFETPFDNYQVDYDYADVNGDGVPDLLVTAVPGELGFGEARWRVHFGNADPSIGWSAPGTDWRLPGEEFLGDLSFEGGADGNAYPVCKTGLEHKPAWYLRDYNADGRPDLRMMKECWRGYGEDTQRIFLGTNEGFGPEQALRVPGQDFAGPSTFADYQLDPARCLGTGVSIPSFLHLDLTGDKVLDLIILEDCDDPLVGETHYLVYPGASDGSGFSVAPFEFQLPGANYAGDKSFSYPVASRHSPDCGQTRGLGSRFVDFNSDGFMDLLITELCPTEPGSIDWILHLGNGTGMSPDGLRLAVPWGLPGVSNSVTSLGARRFSSKGKLPLRDMNADGWLDLVYFDDPRDPEAGKTKWNVYYMNHVCGGATSP